MKLTQEQIAKIDETLVLNKVVYDDIKLELTDHIASDVEEIITNQEVCFEVALKEAFERWQEQLKPFSDWFRGSTGYPKLVDDKLQKLSKKQMLISVLLTVIIAVFIFGSVKIFNCERIVEIIYYIYKPLVLIVFFLLIIGRIFMFQYKHETTFEHLFKDQFFSIICMSIINLYFLLYQDILYYTISNELFFALIVITFYLTYSILSASLLFKHFEFQRKLSKV